MYNDLSLNLPHLPYLAVNKSSFGSSIVKIGSTIVMCFIEGALTKKSLESVKSTAKLPEKDQYFGINRIFSHELLTFFFNRC